MSLSTKKAAKKLIKVAKEHPERDVADDRVGDEGSQDPAPRDGFLLLVHG